MIIISFIATEFLTFAWVYCRDRIFLCRDIVLLSCIAGTKLRVATDSEDVVTYFLLLSLSLAGLFVATLKSLSRQTCLSLFHFSSIFYRSIVFFCRDRNFLLYSVYYCDINFIIETKLYFHCLIIIAIEISAFSSSLCYDRLFYVTAFILQFFSSFVEIIDFFVETYFTSTLCCVFREIKLVCRGSFFAIFSSLCCDRVEKCHDKVPLSFSFINVATEL